MNPDDLAHALRAAFPEADPFAVPWDDLALEVRRLGADPADDRFMTEALVAWEALL